MKYRRKLSFYAPLAQLDRACGYGPQGRGFEFSTARHVFLVLSVTIFEDDRFIVCHLQLSYTMQLFSPSTQFNYAFFIRVWRRLVARLNGVQEAAGSTPVTRTTCLFFAKRKGKTKRNDVPTACLKCLWRACRACGWQISAGFSIKDIFYPRQSFYFKALSGILFFCEVYFFI